MSHYSAGRRYEWRSRDALRKRGYFVIRAAGSKGPADLIGLRSTGGVLVQVKSGNASGLDYRKLQLCPCPPGFWREMHLWVKGKLNAVLVADPSGQPKLLVEETPIRSARKSVRGKKSK